MEIDKEFLEKTQGKLEEQYGELKQELTTISNQMLEVKGAVMWVRQTLKLLEPE